MVKPDELGWELRARIDAYFEWLLVRPDGRTFPVRRTEIGIDNDGETVAFSILDDRGVEVLHVVSFESDENDLLLSLTNLETIRLVPRTPARELAMNVERARLERANVIAAAIVESMPDYKIVRVAVGIENARLTQIFLRDRSGGDVAAMCDLTGTMTHEAVMASAAIWWERLKRRKKPIDGVWIVSDKKQARSLRKLHGTFHQNAAARFRNFEIVPNGEAIRIKELTRIKPSAMWREKPKRVTLPADVSPSDTAAAIMDLAPEKTDVIFSKQGETIRFLGLPFARVRSVAGDERAWFGIDRERRSITHDTMNDLADLVADLEKYRSHDSPNKRHELYRASPEAWLESILRRNIKLLDANLILSPIYNQFRTSSDKIDLLAIRRDGRLVIIELKISPDRETVFQAADYWRKIEIQRRRGELARIRAFGDMEIIDKPALVYAVAPALGFHHEFELFAGMLSSDVELWRFDLHESWRREVKVLQRRSTDEPMRLIG